MINEWEQHTLEFMCRRVMVLATCINCNSNIHTLLKVYVKGSWLQTYHKSESSIAAISWVVSGHTLESSTFVNINEF